MIPWIEPYSEHWFSITVPSAAEILSYMLQCNLLIIKPDITVSPKRKYTLLSRWVLKTEGGQIRRWHAFATHIPVAMLSILSSFNLFKVIALSWSLKTSTATSCTIENNWERLPGDAPLPHNLMKVNSIFWREENGDIDQSLVICKWKVGCVPHTPTLPQGSLTLDYMPLTQVYTFFCCRL